MDCTCKVEDLSSEDYHLVTKILLNFIMNIPFDDKFNNFIQNSLKIKIKLFKIIKSRIKSQITSTDVIDYENIRNAFINNFTGLKKISYGRFGTYFGNVVFDSTINTFVANGFGIMRYNLNPDYYVGNWLNGRRHGIGGIFYICGYSWSGVWEDDVKKDYNTKNSNYTLKKKYKNSKKEIFIWSVAKVENPDVYYLYKLEKEI